MLKGLNNGIHLEYILMGTLFTLLMGTTCTKIVLEDGVQTSNWWGKPPVVPLTRFYFYNVTNYEEFLNNGSKPTLQEIGPYVYEEKWTRKHTTFNDNGTVSYNLEKIYYFNEELSSGTENDVVIVPNIPLLTLTSQLKDSTRFLQLAITSALDILNVKPFVKVTVEGLLWGYEDPLLKISKNMFPEGNKYPYDEFGLMLNKNGTLGDKFTTFTEDGEASKSGLIDSINGMTHTTHWLTDKCNSLLASTGSFFPPQLPKNKTLNLYVEDLCRTMPLVFEHEVSRKDNITIWRFSPPANVFDSVDKNPENQCYCPGGPPCSQSGLFNVSLCGFGPPMMMSFPHFYLADDSLRNAFEGISSPDPEKHKFYVDVQPEFGFAMSTRGRLQMNLAVSHVGDIRQVATFPEIIFPIMWFEEAVELKPEGITKLMA